MKYRFQFRRYRLPFRHAVRTGHGVWSEREGVIVRIQAADDGRRTAAGFGEAAPVPGFQMESVDEIEAVCAGMGEIVEAERLRGVPENVPTLKNAITSVIDGDWGLGTGDRANSEKQAPSPIPNPQSPALGVTALLPSGRAALDLIAARSDAGFRVFKWKVGVGDIADELALLDDVCAALPSGAKLRLDANGAWDRRRAERWLERCADRPVEFVEQPCFAPRGATQGAAFSKMDDLLLGLAGDFPTKLALDESLVGDGDVERWLGAGWPGVFVVKPALFGDLAGALEKLGRAKADVVFSSALETKVGARAALRVAFAWQQRQELAQSPAFAEAMAGKRRGAEKATVPRALGFGVWPLFADARFDGPAAAPFIRGEDVERLDGARVWEALRGSDM